MRAGAHALSVLSAPLNVNVLTALAEEPMPLMDLRRELGSPPQTTMRGHLRALAEEGLLERRRENAFPGLVDYQLLQPGRELIAVAQVLQAWLGRDPEGSRELGAPAGKSAIKALVEGWSFGLVRALAARPLALTELSRLITGLTYPSLERRLAALRLAGLVERCPAAGRGRPYAATGWLRQAIGPLAAAARWERQHGGEGAGPIGRIDVEAAFLLAVPVLSLPEAVSGSCRLAVEVGGSAGEPRVAGVMVEVREGAIASCVSRLEGKADAWAAGSPPAFLRAVIDCDTALLEIGGDCEVALALLDGLHGTLFGTPQRV